MFLNDLVVGRWPILIPKAQLLEFLLHGLQLHLQVLSLSAAPLHGLLRGEASFAHNQVRLQIRNLHLERLIFECERIGRRLPIVRLRCLILRLVGLKYQCHALLKHLGCVRNNLVELRGTIRLLTERLAQELAQRLVDGLCLAGALRLKDLKQSLVLGERGAELLRHESQRLVNLKRKVSKDLRSYLHEGAGEATNRVCGCVLSVRCFTRLLKQVLLQLGHSLVQVFVCLRKCLVLILKDGLRLKW